MILSSKEIYKNVSNGKIEISPFKEDRLNPNSYDVALGEKLLEYSGLFVDTSQKNSFIEIIIPKEGFVLQKEKFYVGHIEEYIGNRTGRDKICNEYKIKAIGVIVGSFYFY